MYIKVIEGPLFPIIETVTKINITTSKDIPISWVSFYEVPRYMYEETVQQYTAWVHGQISNEDFIKFMQDNNFNKLPGDSEIKL